VTAVSLSLGALRAWPALRWFVAALVAVVVAAVTGIPTDLVPTSLYRRMTPIPWWSWPLWAATALLAGLLAASYLRDRAGGLRAGSSLSGGVMSFLAVGCPICNKLVVAALGVSGALTYFAPVQPLLGLAGVAALVYALQRRLATSAACAVPASAADRP
jgi:hypothetical protein